VVSGKRNPDYDCRQANQMSSSFKSDNLILYVGFRSLNRPASADFTVLTLSAHPIRENQEHQFEHPALQTKYLYNKEI